MKLMEIIKDDWKKLEKMKAKQGKKMLRIECSDKRMTKTNSSEGGKPI